MRLSANGGPIDAIAQRSHFRAVLFHIAVHHFRCNCHADVGVAVVLFDGVGQRAIQRVGRLLERTLVGDDLPAELRVAILLIGFQGKRQLSA